MHPNNRIVRNRHNHVSRAFTLIELLVVIGIIGLLSSIVLASLGTAKQRGRDSRRISDIKQLQLALELYYDANSAYPLALDTSLTGPGYIPTIPKDPKSNLPYAYVALQGAAASAATCASYHLGTKLEIYTSGSGSVFNDDNDATSAGTYGTGTGDGTVCTGSA